MCNVQTGGESEGGNMSGEGKQLGEYVRGVKNDVREYVREGICLYPNLLRCQFSCVMLVSEKTILSISVLLCWIQCFVFKYG